MHFKQKLRWKYRAVIDIINPILIANTTKMPVYRVDNNITLAYYYF